MMRGLSLRNGIFPFDSNNNRGLMGETMRDVQDGVHGQIRLSPLAFKIINTKEFKRLKNLKQLGNSSEVYPTASHSRFEHSLGVYHLASTVVQELKKLEENLTAEDQLCVEIAALLHDLGHGPFSHLWESFTKLASPDSSWEHEKSSLEMLDLMLANNNIKLEQYGLNPIDDLKFIKELIDGPLDKAAVGYPYKGRGPEKYYLYEIVSNKLTGVDVDKWDYFLRDSRACDLNILFKYERLVSNMKIVDWFYEEYDTTVRRIAYRDKVVEDCQDIFTDRSRLHRRIYQHKTVKVLDRMMIDAWLEADPHFPLINGQKLSEAAKDVKSLVRLTDEWVNQTILNSEDEGLQKARDILERIQSRKTYRILAEITGTIEKDNFYYEKLLSCEFLAVTKIHIDMGKKKKNPVTSMIFFNKEGEKVEPMTDQELSHLAPGRVDYDKLYILLRELNPSADMEEEAKEKIESLITENKDWKVKWNMARRSRKD